MKNIENAIKDNTKLIFVETPTNPMLVLTDLNGVAKIGKKNKLLTVCDNIFMSPFFQNPLDWGIDIVLHSTTKYINGHSDVIGGMIVTSNEKVHERIHYIQNAAGGVPSPFDCWLVLRATKTLAVRIKQHDENAIDFCRLAGKKRRGTKVILSRLKDHPQHELAKKQMRGFGGMVSAEFGSVEKAKKVLNSVKVFTLAESLGGVKA